MKPETTGKYILGIDLGVASLGWALIGTTGAEYSGVLATGVRVFEAGVEGRTEAGQDEPRSAVRREARQRRRQTWRHAWRSKKLFAELQNAELLPAAAEGTRPGAPARHAVLAALDSELRTRWLKAPGRAVGIAAAAASDAAGAAAMPGTPATSPALTHLLPYILRARALDQRLEPYELGRALYQLGQRRGFLSNRRTQAREKEEERSEVKRDIGELRAAIEQAGARTLGEYLAGLDPEQHRVRRRWTARSMFEEEFEKIWAAQQPHHPEILSGNLKKRLHGALFRQRPLKSASHLIGTCEFEKGRRRAPWACVAAQRFRLLQRVNDLCIEGPGMESRQLTPEEGATVIQALEAKGDQKFAALRKLLHLGAGLRFNLERGGETKLPGNRTAGVMRKHFGLRWEQFSQAERDQVVEEWRTIEKPETLARRAVTRWGMSEPEARAWSQDDGPEDGYCHLSRRALAKVLPLLERGMPYATAIKQVYGTAFSGGLVVDVLPPVRKGLPQLRNPAVERALTELRKVVNAIVRRYGKPASVRIELARDLRRARQERKRIWSENRQREAERNDAKAVLEKEIGVKQPTRRDVEKYLLWKECRGFCPYTGKPISRDALFGDAPQFDIEHILPLSRFPDDSFSNKTLCDLEENRSGKRGRTPFEAYGADAERWGQILYRVGRFNNRAKFWRFLIEETDAARLLELFSERQLNDTRYASRLAAQYLGMLYGGRDAQVNGETHRVVHTTLGQVTAELRRVWGLEKILGKTEDGKKARDDHRQHAIDAIVTALTEPRWVKRMSDQAARNADKYGRPSFGGLPGPWPEFVDTVRSAVGGIHVSHRPRHKISGALHEETNYSPPRDGKDGRKRPDGKYVHVRKPLSGLSEKELSDIVDPAVQAAVYKRLEELGGDLKKFQASADPNSDIEPPWLEAHDGRRIPIRRIRIRVKAQVRTVGADDAVRHVRLGNNHHMEIVALVDGEHEIEWEGRLVSLLDAQARLLRKEPVIRREHGPGQMFKFSLMNGDLVELATEDGPMLLVVRTISTNAAGAGLVQMVPGNSAAKVKTPGLRRSRSVDGLREQGCRKVNVSLLGELQPAND